MSYSLSCRPQIPALQLQPSSSPRSSRVHGILEDPGLQVCSELSSGLFPRGHLSQVIGHSSPLLAVSYSELAAFQFQDCRTPWLQCNREMKPLGWKEESRNICLVAGPEHFTTRSRHPLSTSLLSHGLDTGETEQPTIKLGRSSRCR